MSTEAIGAAAPAATTSVAVVAEQPTAVASSKHSGLHSPPDSNNAMNLDGSDSELSDIDEVADKLNAKPHVAHQEPSLSPAMSATDADAADGPASMEGVEIQEEDEDIGEITPDHYSGTVPVFRPNMKQFRNFKRFMEKVDKYGMKSGIVKIIPPQEWKDMLVPLDDMVKQIRVREPIKQDIMGSNGTYRQVNILHQRSYNLPQWRQLCDQSEHQPPARRGERRANAEKHKPAIRSTRSTRSTAASKSAPAPARKQRGRATRGTAKTVIDEAADGDERPMTPVSPPPEKEEVVESVEQDPGVKEEECDDDDSAPVVRRMGFARQSKPKTQSTSARRKYVRREGSARIDEEAFKDWDYRMDVSDYTPERCEELERIYWKTLTYAPPLYGADLMGTLFDESLDVWNLNKLPNLLDVLGTKVPGVNTAYLYLGMWKATFAWHLEDVDLYSINYLHFGAPKQWYSISQADARRFEAAMKNIWPTEAKACDQFLRHKAFLISPSHLKQHYGITVNKCLSYPGEFVVTYPYGYHSGYNLGYNCAEAVNFALDSWLPMGKIAKKCQCAQAQDSVWVDVYEIERKLRGEETEYEETEDEDEEEDDDDDNETGLPSPPSSHTVRIKAPGRKRKRAGDDQGDRSERKRKVRPRLKTHIEPPCCLCPHDIPGAEMMPTEDGRQAHRMCALYLPETYIETVDGKEVVLNVNGIEKARLELKCLYCRSKKGACFQCSQKKCHRAYHATCAAAAGVFVEEEEVPVFGEDGTEYKEQAFEFSCRFHRTKRDKKLDGKALEDNKRIREAAAGLKESNICQIQFLGGEIFAGVVLENRHDEETLLLHVIPNGDRVEVEWKWLLLPDPVDFRLPKASPNAIALPTSRKAQRELNAKRAVDDTPRKDDEFAPGFVWAEFNAGDPIINSTQVKVDLSKENQIWYYLGGSSTELRAQYTEDVTNPVYNPKSSFIDSIPKPPKPAPMAAPPKPKRSYSAAFPQGVLPKVSPVPLPGSVAGMLASKQERPYMYKPRVSSAPGQGFQFSTQQFVPRIAPNPAAQGMLPPQQPRPFTQGPPPSQPVYDQLALQPRQGPHIAPHPRQGHQGHQAHQGHQGYQAQQQQYQVPQPALQMEQYRPPAMEPQPKKSAAAFSSDRFAPDRGGHHSQPLPRVWPATVAAGTGLPPPVMTSPALNPLVSAPPQSGSQGAQPLPNVHQKYTFFQLYNNRDSTRYRTPYREDGFANGYQGNQKVFLMNAQRALAGGKSSSKAIAPAPPPLQPRPAALAGPSGSPGVRYGSPYTRLLPRPNTRSPQLSVETKGEPLSPFFAFIHSPSPAGSNGSGAPGAIPFHSATRQSFEQAWPQSPASQAGGHTGSPQPNSPMSGFFGHPSPRPSSQYGAQARPQPFTKQSHSPIPLPPYVRQAAVSSSPTGQRSSPLSGLPHQAQHQPSPRSTEFTIGPSQPAHHQGQQQSQPLADSSGKLGAPEHSFGNMMAPALPQGAFHGPPELPWAPRYDSQSPAASHQLAAPPKTAVASSPLPQHTIPYTQGLLQPQAQPGEHYNEAAPTGYPDPPAAVDSTTDSTFIVERMMLNLKRATQVEGTD